MTILILGAGIFPSINEYVKNSYVDNTSDLTNLPIPILSNTINAGKINRNTILYVGGQGPNNYSSIQEAINNTNAGDIVFVYNDSSPYFENIIIDNAITMIGENKKTTIIDGENDDIVISVMAENVSIHNFTIKNCSNIDSGIKIGSYSNITIHNCIITYNPYIGILLYDSTLINIQNCTIENNVYSGILFHSSHECTITNCMIANNNLGIDIDSTSSNNRYYHNTFLNNSINAYDTGINIWNDSYPSAGNYWDNYEGQDIFNGPQQNITGPDHIGDIPYNISGGINQDRYPLMTPYGSPYADFTYTITDNTIYLNASLSHAYDSDIIHYNWIFGDSTNGTGMIINHTYIEQGIYLINLTVIDDKNGTGTREKPIPIDNQSPIIIDNTPSVTSSGSLFTINVTITDNTMVDTVFVEYWYDTGQHFNETMQNSENDFWEKTIQINLSSQILNYFITASDIAGNHATTEIKEVTILPNNPPNPPTNPQPANGASNISITIDINWFCDDPNGDQLFFDVYFGNSYPPPIASHNQTSLSYDPSLLEKNTKYYWKINAWDEHQALTSGPDWNFSTIPSEIITIKITKPLNNSCYIQNQLILPLLQNIVIIGPINITADVVAENDIEKVEFIIDDTIVNNDTEEPYDYYWDTIISFRLMPFSFNHTVKAIAYDTEGNYDADEVVIWKWRIHPIIFLAGGLFILRILTR